MSVAVSRPPVRKSAVAVAIAAAALVTTALLVTPSSAVGPDPQPRVEARTVECVTDTVGVCTVPHGLGVVPSAVLLTPTVPAGQPAYGLSTVDGSVSDAVVGVRASWSAGHLVASTLIRFSMSVFGGALPVPPTTTTQTTTTTVPPVTTTTTALPPVTTTTVPPTTTTTPPPVGLMGWELNASNTGLARNGLTCAGLPQYSGPSKLARGTKLYRLRVTVPLDLAAGDILIDQSCIAPNGTTSVVESLVTTTTCAGDNCTATAVGNVVIRDSEITAEHLSDATIPRSCAFLGVGTLQRNYMHGMGSGICFFETGPTHSALAEGNYVTHLRAANGSHNEAATVRDFRDSPNRTVKFLNNRLDCQTSADTGGLFIQPTWLPIYHLTVQGNYLEGGGYNLYLERTGNATYGDVHSVNNRFRSTGWGPSATVSGPGWVEWRDNYRLDPTKADARGAVVNP